MSLKVNRGFKTYSEDAIIDTYSRMRRTHQYQDRMAARRANDRQSLSFVAKLAIAAVVVIAAAALARPVLHYVQSIL